MSQENVDGNNPSTVSNISIMEMQETEKNSQENVSLPLLTNTTTVSMPTPVAISPNQTVTIQRMPTQPVWTKTEGKDKPGVVVSKMSNNALFNTIQFNKNMSGKNSVLLKMQGTDHPLQFKTLTTTGSAGPSKVIVLNTNPLNLGGIKLNPQYHLTGSKITIPKATVASTTTGGPNVLQNVLIKGPIQTPGAPVSQNQVYITTAHLIPFQNSNQTLLQIKPKGGPTKNIRGGNIAINHNHKVNESGGNKDFPHLLSSSQVKITKQIVAEKTAKNVPEKPDKRNDEMKTDILPPKFEPKKNPLSILMPLNQAKHKLSIRSNSAKTSMSSQSISETPSRRKSFPVDNNVQQTDESALKNCSNKITENPLPFLICHEKLKSDLEKTALPRNSFQSILKPKPEVSKTEEVKLPEPCIETSIKAHEISREIVNNKHDIKSITHSQPRIKKQQLQIKKEFKDLNVEFEQKSNALHRKPRLQQTKPKLKLVYQVANENKDPIKSLTWQNGIGYLEKSELHFRKNEFGVYDLLDSLEYDALLTGCKDMKYHTPLAKRDPTRVRETKPTSPEDLYCCTSCGCHGSAVEFITPDFCSTACSDDYKEKRVLQTKRDKELEKEQAECEFLQKRKGNWKFLPQGLKLNQIDNNELATNDSNDVNSPQPNTPARSDVDNDQDNDSDSNKNQKYPWMHGKTGFSWTKYLDHTKATAAPMKLFKDPLPYRYQKNSFKVGMKMESIDPDRESLFCVVTVTEVQGFRMRLHFDGYPDVHDFWVNADSIDIFPPGWCEKNNKVLNPPKGYTASSFNWMLYLKYSKAVAAPRNLFNHINMSVCPNGFRIGMKLEALDRKNSNLVCVASVTDTLEHRFLVHFDSWGDIYDYWADPSSPYIHPVGWSEENGETLIPPNYYDQHTFSWSGYLKDTQSLPAPARAFKHRSPVGFRPGMKLEVVDKRVPFLIRVATVDEVKNYKIKISFDGWPPRYSFWVEEDSPDIHPIGWCHKTEHALESPLTPDDLYIPSDCPTPGCLGLGHVEQHPSNRHVGTEFCPYAIHNMNRKNMRPDRLAQPQDSPPVLIPFEPAKKRGSENSDVNTRRHSKSRRLTDNGEHKLEIQFTPPPLDEIPKQNASRVRKNIAGPKRQSTEKFIFKESRERKRRNDNNKDHKRVETEVTANENIELGNTEEVEMLKEPRTNKIFEVKHSVLTPGYEPNPKIYNQELWLKYSKHLNKTLDQGSGLDLNKWSEHDVANYIQLIRGCSQYRDVFKMDKVDGKCLRHLKQNDLTSTLGIKLGPAIKIFNAIQLLLKKTRDGNTDKTTELIKME